MTSPGPYKIKFTKKRPEIKVNPDETLMQNLLRAGLPVASSCRGEGVCAKCRILVIEGWAHLNPPNETEAFLRDRHSFAKNERVSCQIRIFGDVTVDASYW